MFNFNALVSRIKYIPRWSLMRQSRQEYLAEHTTEVMHIAHTLAVLAKEKFGAEVDEKNIVLCGLYHDISEILTGDMPTPVKYNDDVLKKAYKDMESKAMDKMIETIDPAVKENIAPFVKGTVLHAANTTTNSSNKKFLFFISLIYFSNFYTDLSLNLSCSSAYQR